MKNKLTTKYITIKKVLLVSFFFLTIKCHGQQTFFIKQPDPIFKYDTVKIIMLVSDTAKYINYTTGDTSSFAAHHSIYWIAGYVATKSQQYLLYTSTIASPFCEASYLDDNKKVLSKNIIVWQTK